MSLALLVLLPTGCLTSRHRPVTPVDPTWVSVRISPALVRTLLAQDGHPFSPHRLPHVPRVVGEVIGTTLAITVTVAIVVSVAVVLARAGAGGAMGGVVNGMLGPSVDSASATGAGGGVWGDLDEKLTAFLICRDAASGELVDRQHLVTGPHGIMAVPLERGQQGRLELEVDDGTRLVAIPLATILASPRQRVEITVRAAPEPEPTAPPPLAPTP
ncbi:MAG: hypothetical protein H0X38_14250 [Planctomycetes bacterium]|nr:hypothetical protein [Planctomycetota bacterium]